ncbi:hypothetical protein CEXT_60041 [Caerostris extrusa]|uniref:Uncharacterized protein n=1 Tax=Caerostris extrusa TaxID=172846 RepID=A0AAV4S2K3_CAEEX|nr:hypothetical protein CEXT_60041 [Caerostris extrusa]
MHDGLIYVKVYNNIKVMVPDGNVKHIEEYEIRGYCYRCLANGVSFEEDQGFYGKIKVTKIGEHRTLIKVYAKEN